MLLLLRPLLSLLHHCRSRIDTSFIHIVSCLQMFRCPSSLSLKMNFASFISQQRFLNFIATTLKTAFITIRFIAHSRLAMQKIECYVTHVLNVCRMKLTFYFLYYYYYYYSCHTSVCPHDKTKTVENTMHRTWHGDSPSRYFVYTIEYQVKKSKGHKVQKDDRVVCVSYALYRVPIFQLLLLLLLL